MPHRPPPATSVTGWPYDRSTERDTPSPSPSAGGRAAEEPTRLFEALADAGRVILHAGSEDEVLAGVCEAAVHHGLFRLAWVGRVVDGTIQAVAARGAGAGHLDGLRLPLDSQTPTSRAIRTGRSVVVHDIATEPGFAQRDEAIAAGMRAMCALPLRDEHAVIGALVVHPPLGTGLSPGAVKLLERLADDVTFALTGIAHRRAEAEAREMARRAEAVRTALLRQHQDVAAIVETTGDVRWMSETIERITGFGSDTYLGQFAPGVHPDDLARVLPEATVALSEPGTEALFTIRMAHADGSWRWVEVRTTNLVDDPLIDGVVCSFHDVTDARAAAAAVEFRSDLLASVGDAVVASDAEGRITYMNAAALALGPWDEDEVMGRSVLDLLPFTTMEDDLPGIRRAVFEARPWSGELTYRLPGGREVPMLTTNTPIVRDGHLVGMIGVARDVSELWQARIRLEARASMQTEVARLGQIALRAESPTEVMAAVVDSAGPLLGVDTVVVVQASAGDRLTVRARWGGYPASPGEPARSDRQLDLGSLDIQVGRPLLIADLADEPLLRRRRGMSEGLFTSGAVVAIGGRDGVFGCLVAMTKDRRSFDADVVSYLEALANVIAASVEREDAQLELVRAGLTDDLTRLPNRVLLRDRVDQALARARRAGTQVGVLIIDLDRFKELNDAYGHETGDELLAAVAGRLAEVLPAEDTLARLGGDEFAVLCEAVDRIEQVTDRATSVAAALADPFLLGDELELFVTASVGISVRGIGATAEVLLREADAALYRAKDAGRGRHELFDEDLRESAVRRVGTATALRHAVGRGELRVLWQPEVRLGPSGAETASDLWVEALVRWEHPERGLLGPDAFIPLAEETGLIVPLGEHVVRAACQQLAEWRAAGGWAPGRIAVNLSPRQLAHDGLVDALRRAVDDAGVDADSVVLELTESAVMTDPDDAIALLVRLRELGFHLAIDDFGTGYSSLGYLRRLPVSVLKIDRVFVNGMTEHREDWSIVKGTIELAHALGIGVVAEGVETDDQLAQLVALGCERAQGWLWSPAVTADEVAAFATRPT